MPKKYLLTGSEIRSFRPTSRVHGGFFSLSIGKTTGRAKCATVVSKKVAVKATDRNLIKRRARNVLSPLMAKLDSPVALMLVAKKEAAKATFADLQADIRRLFAKVPTT